MARLVRAATDRNPPTLGGGGCQSIYGKEQTKFALAQNDYTGNNAVCP